MESRTDCILKNSEGECPIDGAFTLCSEVITCPYSEKQLRDLIYEKTDRYNNNYHRRGL